MEGSRRLLGLGGGGPATQSLAGSAAADVQVDADAESPIAVREIVAAIDLVARGLAVRVSLIGFDMTSDLVREAAEVARGSGCRSIATIGAGGRLGLVITGGKVEGG